jgi:hypothetical protein
MKKLWAILFCTAVALPFSTLTGCETAEEEETVTRWEDGSMDKTERKVFRGDEGGRKEVIERESKRDGEERKEVIERETK